MIWSNVVCTKEGEDAIDLEYRATFADGRLTRIEEVENRSEPALAYQPPEPSTPEEVARKKSRRAENLLGRKMFKSRGADEDGYEVTVVNENSKSWVAEGPNEKFEIISRYASRTGNTI